LLNITVDYPGGPAFWQQWFGTTIVDPAAWVDTANDLTRALSLLGAQIEAALSNSVNAPSAGLDERLFLHPTYMMLVAYAVENYLKGALVAKSGWTVADVSSKFPTALKSHNLLDLMSKLDLHVNVEERDLLERVATYSIWAGRYPVPLSAEHLKPAEIGSNAGVPPRCARGSDTAVAECLLHKLACLLKSGSLPTASRRTNAYDGQVTLSYLQAF